ncbi:MAG: hypothetical protein ACRDR6_11625 [Pseudonocardiaceae bacterium]
MTSSAFLDLSDTDRYLLRRLAVLRHVPAEELAAGLAPTEIEQRIPGAREAYEHRDQTAAELLRRQGIDPTSPEYRTAAESARGVLDQIDQLGSDRTE